MGDTWQQWSNTWRQWSTARVFSASGIAFLVAVSALLVGGFAVADGGSAATQQADGGGFSGTTNLSEARTNFSGVAENDTAGWSVSNAGDVNGDGVDDLLIGAPENNTAGNDSGAVYVVYGPAETGDVSLADADVTINGTASFDRAGESVSNAGDVNGDGYADIVIGAPGSDLPEPDSGAAYVVYGNESLSSSLSLADADVVLRGPERDARLGGSVSNVSGLADNSSVLVGAAFADNETGAAYLVSGDELTEGDDLLLDDDNTTAILTGESRGDVAGASVSHAGDVNDDGTPDLLVGASNWTATSSQEARNETLGAGAAYVVYGPVTGQRNLSTANLSIRGVDRFGRVGFSVSAAGDVNNDSDADVIVGAPFADPGGEGKAGMAAIVYGSETLSGEIQITEADVRLTGEAPGDRAGWSVSAAGSGDVTCDGVDDVLVGAPQNDTGGVDAGAAYVVNGLPGLSGNVSLSEADAKFFGEAAGDRAGKAVSEAGDLDNDTFDDIVVGAPRRDVGNDTDAGAAYLLINDCVTPESPTPTPTATPTPTPTETPAVDLDRVETSTRCTAEGADLTVENPNDESVRVTVEGPDGFEREVELDAGEERTFRGLGDGGYDVRTTTTGEDGPVRSVGQETVHVFCATEQVDVERQCTADGGQITIENPNEEPVRVSVEGPDGFEKRVTLAPGASRTVTGLDDGDYTVTTRSAEGADYRIGRESVSIDCPTEQVELEQRCTADGGEVTLENPNGEPVRVSVEGPDGFEQRVTIPGDGSRTISGLDDGEYRVVTFSAVRGNHYRIGQERSTVSCPTERVEVAQRCTDDGGELTVTNPNDESVEVEIEGPDDYERQVTLDAGESRTVAELANGDYSIVTRSDIDGNEYRIGRESVTVDCETPTPTPTPTETPTPTQTPGQNAISFVAFCFEDGDEATVTITNVTLDEGGEPFSVNYSVTDDEPTVVVHKAGQPIYQQAGNLSGTVTQGVGLNVTNNRTANSPCRIGQIALKFEKDQDELREDVQKSFPDDVDGDDDGAPGGGAGNMPAQGEPPLFDVMSDAVDELLGLFGAAVVSLVALGRRD